MWTWKTRLFCVAHGHVVMHHSMLVRDTMLVGVLNRKSKTDEESVGQHKTAAR